VTGAIAVVARFRLVNLKFEICNFQFAIRMDEDEHERLTCTPVAYRCLAPPRWGLARGGAYITQADGADGLG
jgi:hypothetical protein